MDLAVRLRHKVASENENVYTEEKLVKIDGMGAVLVFSS